MQLTSRAKSARQRKFRFWPNPSTDMKGLIKSLDQARPTLLLKYEAHKSTHEFGSFDQLLDHARFDLLDLAQIGPLLNFSF